MNTSLKLSAEHREAVAARRKLIASCMAPLAAMEKEECKLAGKDGECEEQLRRCEAHLDPANSASVDAQASALRQRVAIERRLETLRAENAGAHAALQLSLYNFSELLCPIMQPVYHELVEEIETKLQPYFARPGAARAVARESDIVCALGRFYNPTWGVSASAMLEAREALRILDALVDGKNPFTFQTPPA